MGKQRFSNFNLFTIHYPLTAIISILHRLSGIFVFLLTPFLLWMLTVASESPKGFAQVQALVANPAGKLLLWFILVALWYHFMAGIRHLLMDVGMGESLKSGRLSGVITLATTLIAAILAGIWLW